MKETIRDELKDAAVRPTTPAYQNGSTVISATLSPPSNMDPRQTNQTLRDRIEDALQLKGVLQS